MKLSLQIVSANDAEFENVLHEAIVNGNWQMCWLFQL